jgi:hypothetical protein
MKPISSIRRFSPPVAFLAASLTILLSPASTAQQPAPQGEGDQEIQQTVARVAYRSGPATYSRGDDPENWQDVAVNVPLTLGDRVYTGKDGRLELDTGGTRIFVAPETQVTALDLRDDVRQLSVSIGTATFRVRRLADGEVFEVDTPNVSVTFRKPGHYRVDVDAEGNTRFVLYEGGALGVAGGGQVDLAQGDAMEVEGTDQPRYDLVAQPAWDRWDRWVDDRVRPHKEPVSAKYVSEEVVGVEDLDEDGSWEDIPDHGHAWTPRGVAVGWAPYQDGRWMWQDPWGWSWVGAERWGWAPYHYGSWTSWHNRWFWLPGPRGERGIHYSPARVVFAGGPPGHGMMGGHVGWFPIGPREPFSPWWGHRPPMPIAPGFGFMNRGFMHAVPQATFVGGGFVQHHMIHDAAIMRGLASAPFIHGPLPFLPTPASIRMPMPPGLRGPMLRPPDAFISRSVVTRLAPPLAPPGFSTKVGFIRENHGMPVDRRASEKLSVDHYKGARAVADFRPASGTGGKVDFAPKRDFGQGHKVQPMSMTSQGQGRAFATHEKPLGIQSKELQTYQRPVGETRGQQGTKSFGQGQGTSGSSGLVHVQKDGQQGSGQIGTTGQGFSKKNDFKTTQGGTVQNQGQGQQTTSRTGTTGQGFNKKNDFKTTQGGTVQNQGQGQQTTSRTLGTTGQGLNKKEVKTTQGGTAQTQGQQSQTMSKKTEFRSTGQQGATHSSVQNQQVQKKIDHPVENRSVVKQPVQQQLVKPQVQKSAPVVHQAPPPPPKVEKKPVH